MTTAVSGPKQGGFTLIELMLILAVIAILAAVAYPPYRESALKGRRAQARGALAELLQQQERYMTQHNTYLAFSNADGATSPSPVPFKTQAGDGAASYWLSARPCPGGGDVRSCIQVIATPRHADPRAGSLTLTSAGAKGCTGPAAASDFQLCWP